MDKIKQSFLQLYAKLKDLYLSMTFGNRVVASLLMVMLLLSLGYLIIGSIKPADPASKTVKMFDGYSFNSNEKRQAEFALSNAGLQGHQWIGDQMQVPIHLKSTYAAVLAEANVLERSGIARMNTAEGLTPWQSKVMMDTKMLTAKERDCIDAIKKLPGIAEVSILSNKRPSWNRNVWARTQITSVGVTVEAIENKPLPIDTIGAIGRLVAAAFGITDLKEISIVDGRHSRAYDGSGEQQSSSQSEYLRHQVRYQDEWSNKLYQFLPKIEGLKIETSVELTTFRSREGFEVAHGKPTELVTHQMGYDFRKEGYDRFGRPGQIAQFSRTQIDPTADISPKDLTTEKKHEEEITNALQGTETKQTDLPYIPMRIFASIQIPREHILAIWQNKNRQATEPPTDEQLRAEEELYAAETKNSVAKLLEPYRTAKIDPLSLVQVTYYDPLKPEEIPLTAWEQFVLFMQHNWQTLSLMSLVFGGMFVLWAISKPPKPEPIVIYEGLDTPLEAIDARIAEKRRLEEEARLAAEAAEAAAEEEQTDMENSLGALGSIRSLREEIAELIAKNPEAATAVIRQWIGNAVLVEAKQ